MDLHSPVIPNTWAPGLVRQFLLPLTNLPSFRRADSLPQAVPSSIPLKKGPDEEELAPLLRQS